jgi:hypothetical protein
MIYFVLGVLLILMFRTCDVGTIGSMRQGENERQDLHFLGLMFTWRTHPKFFQFTRDA